MSAIPGFGGGSSMVDDEGSSKASISVDIPQGSEWRFEIPFKTILKFKVTRGVGEIFGTELPSNVELNLSGVKLALYSPLPEGCSVEYTTTPNKNNMTNEVDEIIEYTSEETTMTQYTNLHLAMESMRQAVSDHNVINPGNLKSGPRVLIIGDRFSGKTSLAKILSSYATKMDSTPVLVNLNPRDGVFSLPGSITATTISDSFNIECAGGWGFTTTSGSLYHNPKQPIVKNIGFGDFKDNLDLYKYQISKMGVTVMSRLEEDINVRNSGIIIDTPPLTIKDSTIIENIVSDFEVNVIVVIGNERLLIDLNKKFKHKLAGGQLNIIKLLKSGGTVEADEQHIRRLQEETIKEYFHGNFKTRLSPFKTDIDANDYVIYKGVMSLEINSSFLPAGDSYTAEESEGDQVKKEDSALEKYLALLSEPSSSNLDNSILAIMQLPQSNKLGKELLNSSVLGYVHVSKFDDAKGKMKILLPFPGAFPRNVLISTHINYTE